MIEYCKLPISIFEQCDKLLPSTHIYDPLVENGSADVHVTCKCSVCLFDINIKFIKID